MTAANSSTFASSPLDDPLLLQPSYFPFYYSNKPDLFESLEDRYLTLAAPVLAYWFLSLVFHFLDTRNWKVLDKYRLHPSAEVASKNLVSRSTVVYAVIFQHIIQTLLGLLWLSHEPPKSIPHAVAIHRIASILQKPLVAIGIKYPSLVVSVAQFVYWWGIPAFQLFASMFIIDTWQYFWHRGMHVNKFLYKHFHSWHHRLYVPYAFGALYNHPVEGFILDSLGAAIAEFITGLSMRQAMVLFTLSTFKTVDDHCGYSFPWDPLQLMSGNNADYHDIHHQVIGIKSNFAQPFFVHWDALLGTRMTRADIEKRRREQKTRTAKAQ